MPTQAQVDANRRNASRSTGPGRTDRTRFNGLKHGLRAEQVVLPGEDPAEFEAERQAWIDDWRPKSHTRAVLVERAAVASWRLRRAVRSEAATRSRAADDAAFAFDAELRERVERAVDRFEDDPKAALSLLESTAAGIDRLLGAWGELDAALESGPAAWCQERYHARLMLLLGHPRVGGLYEAGPLPQASARLLRSYAPGAKPLPAGEAEGSVARLRRLAAGAMDRLRELRRHAPNPSADRRRAMEAASADTSKEAQLRHRYEMAHEQSLRSSIRGLLALEKSGADLPDEPEPQPAPAPEAGPAAAPEAVAAPAGADAPGKSITTIDYSTTCAELASVGAAAPSGVRSGEGAGSPGRPGRPAGADPGPEMAPNRS